MVRTSGSSLGSLRPAPFSVGSHTSRAGSLLIVGLLLHFNTDVGPLARSGRATACCSIPRQLLSGQAHAPSVFAPPPFSFSLSLPRIFLLYPSVPYKSLRLLLPRGASSSWRAGTFVVQRTCSSTPNIRLPRFRQAETETNTHTTILQGHHSQARCERGSSAQVGS